MGEVGVVVMPCSQEWINSELSFPLTEGERLGEESNQSSADVSKGIMAKEGTDVVDG